MEQDCLFCKIIRGEIKAKEVYQDDFVYAFEDIDPKAPVHILCIPKQHIESLQDINAENAPIIAHIFEVIQKLALQKGLENGYRVVSNCGEDGGQTVKHLHFHLLGGRSFGWPPG